MHTHTHTVCANTSLNRKIQKMNLFFSFFASYVHSCIHFHQIKVQSANNFLMQLRAHKMNVSFVAKYFICLHNICFNSKPELVISLQFRVDLIFSKHFNQFIISLFLWLLFFIDLQNSLNILNIHFAFLN